MTTPPETRPRGRDRRHPRSLALPRLRRARPPRRHRRVPRPQRALSRPRHVDARRAGLRARVVHLPGQGGRTARGDRARLLPQPRHGGGLRHRQRARAPHHRAGPQEVPHRPHGHDASGPSTSRCVEPFRRWRLTLDPDRARHRLRHHLARYEATRLPPAGRRHHRRRPRRQPGRRLRRLRPPGGLGRGARRALRAGTGHPPRHPRPSLGHARRRRRARPLHGYATPAQR